MSDATLLNAMPPSSQSTQQSRRSFLRGSAAAVAGAMTAALAAETAQNFLTPHSVLAQSTMTPDAALKELMDGNRRFTSGKATAHALDMAILKQHLEEKQEPYAAVLSCADSRVPVEIVFDQTIGHLFVTRVAGNIITPEIIGSLEYGVAVLGTKVILVLGHSNCGAVKAAVGGKSVPGQISVLYPHIQPAVDEAGPDYVAVTKANAKIQAKLLSQASTVISEKIKEGHLKVVAGYFDIGTDIVTLLT